jgi:hypothetical protein
VIIKCKNSQTRIKYIYLRKLKLNRTQIFQEPEKYKLEESKEGYFIHGFQKGKKKKKVSIAALKHLKIEEIRY